MSEPVAAPRNTPLELKLRIMLRNWSYPEFREVLYREAKESENYKEANIYKRLYAFLRALELDEQGLDRDKVRVAIKNEVGYMPSRSVMANWFRYKSTPLGCMVVFDVRRPEVGLLMGLIISDGFMSQTYYRNRLKDRKGELSNKKENVIRKFKKACSNLGVSVCEGTRSSGFGEGEVRWFKITSTLLYLLVKRYDEFIIKTVPEVQLAFIRGLWLGDGHIGSKVSLYNTDPTLIKIVDKLLDNYGVRHSILGPYRPREPLGKSEYYVVNVWTCSRKLFLEMTGLAESPPRPSTSLL